MAKYTIRTTMRPHEDIEVEGPELLDLHRQGLVVPPLPAPAAEFVERKGEPEPVEPEPVADEPTPAPQRTRKTRFTNDGGK